jgi:DNA-binding NtrC family response regulator
MGELVKNRLASIADLLRRKEFKTALKKLQEIDTSEWSDSDKAYHSLLRAETKIWLGDTDVTDLLNHSIEFYRDIGNDILYAKAKYLLGRNLIALGEHFNARELLLEAYVYFKRHNRPEYEQLALNYMAFGQYQTGAIDDAIRNLEKSIEINEKLYRYDNVLTYKRNLALIQLKTGYINKAINELQSISNEIKNQSRYDNIQYHLICALANALIYEPKKANKHLKQITGQIDLYRREKALYFEYLGWILLLDGRYEEAISELQSGVALSDEIAPESALISQTRRLLADSYIGFMNFDLARKNAIRALEVAEKINERVEIAGCYRVFAQVALNDEKTDEARDWFRKAAEIYELIRSRYELAVTRYLMATSKIYRFSRNAALLYQARDYFASENIAHYIEKIDKHLNSMEQRGRIIPAPPDKDIFIARQPKMKKILALAEHIAIADMTVLLTGPTGSGKDHLARYIHNYSGRDGKFVTVNCAAIPDSMVESELFGHTKGAFTGAGMERIGLFEEANGGTLYLNEIADSSPAFQAKLLEVIENREIRRLGENNNRRIDLRFIAATNYDLPERLKNNRFRLDLYHRLNEIPISLPALEERPDDIRALVHHFLKMNSCPIEENDEKFVQICKVLCGREWPGNVRELKLEINRLCLLSEWNPDRILERLYADRLSKEEELLKMLEETDWNQSETGRRLGIAESTVRKRIKKYGLTQE